MVAEPIANFDFYIWVAIGLFVAGIISVMVYDDTASKSKRHEQHRSGISSESE
jgi:hypothetical protein